MEKVVLSRIVLKVVRIVCFVWLFGLAVDGSEKGRLREIPGGNVGNRGGRGHERRNFVWGKDNNARWHRVLKILKVSVEDKKLCLAVRA